jgi:nitroreductase
LGKENTLASLQKTENHLDVAASRFGKVTRQKLNEDETSQLLSLTALSLSAFNINNCRFVVVRDPDLRKQINKFSLDQTPSPPLSSLIILCAELQNGENGQGQNGHGGLEAPAAPKKGFRRDHERLHRDAAMCSCGIAAQTFMLTAKAMGYDSWRLDGFQGEAIGKLINLPDDYVVGLLLLVGKNLKPTWPNGGQVNIHELMVLDQF